MSLSATATETLWALLAGEQMVAVDKQSEDPDDVPTMDLSDHEPSVKAILAYAPDLVMTSGDDPELRGALEKAGVTVLAFPLATDLEEAYPPGGTDRHGDRARRGGGAGRQAHAGRSLLATFGAYSPH